MSVLVVRSIIYKRIWTLLEASASVCHPTHKNLVRPNNRIRLDTDRRDPQKQTKSTGDFPEIALSYGAYVYRGQKRGGRYGQHIGGVTGRTKELVQGFTLTLTHEDMRAEINDPLDIAVIEAIEAGGPGMGLCPTPLPFVERGDLTAQTDYGFTEQAGGTTRQQTTIRFDVTARWQSDLAPTQTI